MTKAEAKHLSRVAALGCIVCRQQGYFDSPAEIHHPRAGQGMGQRSSHFEAIGLCPIHHRTGGYRTAIHAGQEVWEKRYGTERELLAAVRGLLGIEQEQGEGA